LGLMTHHLSDIPRMDTPLPETSTSMSTHNSREGFDFSRGRFITKGVNPACVTRSAK